MASLIITSSSTDWTFSSILARCCYTDAAHTEQLLDSISTCVHAADSTMIDRVSLSRRLYIENFHGISSTTIESRKFRIPSDLRRQPGYRPVSSKVGDHLRILLGVVVPSFLTRLHHHVGLIGLGQFSLSNFTYSRVSQPFVVRRVVSRCRSYVPRSIIQLAQLSWLEICIRLDGDGDRTRQDPRFLRFPEISTGSTPSCLPQVC